VERDSEVREDKMINHVIGGTDFSDLKGEDEMSIKFIFEVPGTIPTHHSAYSLLN